MMERTFFCSLQGPGLDLDAAIPDWALEFSWNLPESRQKSFVGPIFLAVAHGGSPGSPNGMGGDDRAACSTEVEVKSRLVVMTGCRPDGAPELLRPLP
jgi:hypothetical protein